MSTKLVLTVCVWCCVPVLAAAIPPSDQSRKMTRPQPSRPTASNNTPSLSQGVARPQPPSFGRTTPGSYNTNAHRQEQASLLPGGVNNRPDYNRPGSNRPGYDRPGDNRPGDNRPGDNRPGDNRPGDNRPGDNRPGDNRPGDNRPGDNRPGDNRPGDNRPGDNRPGDNRPGDNRPGDNRPGNYNRPAYGGSNSNNNYINRPDVVVNRPDININRPTINRPTVNVNRPITNINNTHVNNTHVNNTVINNSTVINQNYGNQNFNNRPNNYQNYGNNYGGNYGGYRPPRDYYPQLHNHWQPAVWSASYSPAYYNYSYSVSAAGGGVMSFGATNYAYANPFYVRPTTTVVAYDYSRPLRVPPPDYRETDDDMIRSERAIRRFDDAREVFRRGEYGRANELIDEAIEFLPSDPNLHQFRSLVLFARQKYPDSAATLYSVLAVSPGWTTDTIAKLYDDPKVYLSHVRELENYVRANSRSLDAQFLLAYHELIKGELGLARQLLQNVQRTQPDDRVVANLLTALREAAPAATPRVSELP